MALESHPDHDQNQSAHDETEDMETARSTIKSERNTTTEPNVENHSQTRSSISRLARWFINLTPQWLTLLSIIIGIYHFDRNMTAKRTSDARIAVSEFIAQLTELKWEAMLASGALKKTNSIENQAATMEFMLNPMIISRAQILIDGEDTGVFTSDLLRFLLTSDMGNIIGPSMSKAEPFIDISSSRFVGSKLSSATIKDASIQCVAFDSGNFSNLVFEKGYYDQVLVSNLKLSSVHFKESWLKHLHFYKVDFYDNISFKEAKLIGTEFHDVRFVSSVPSFEGALIVHSNLQDIVFQPDSNNVEVTSSEENTKKMAEKMAIELISAQSLYKSKFSGPVKNEIRRLLDDKDYDRLMNEPPLAIFGVSENGAEVLADPEEILRRSHEIEKFNHSDSKPERLELLDTVWSQDNCVEKRVRDSRIRSNNLLAASRAHIDSMFGAVGIQTALARGN